ncbi:MAG TPA: hypothetical protein DGK91_11980 [Clostridium sp.]|nr:hypothetical protein [Clostridia bacterium]HCW05171.1 hypothetical protein [Clostridium sp.]
MDLKEILQKIKVTAVTIGASTETDRDFTSRIAENYVELSNAKIVDRVQWVEEGNCYGHSVVGTVATKDIGDIKKLTVHYTYDNKNWTFIEAYFVRKASNGIYVWDFETPLNLPDRKDKDFLCRFAIKYEVDGKEYWDNNKENDYYLWTKYEYDDDNDLRYVLGNINVSVIDFGRACDYNKSSKDYLAGTIILRNLYYSKEVRVRYTTDNWKSFKEERAYYKWNNSDFIELWSFVIPDIPKDDKVQFCISYTVGGKTYWDNNFQDNYQV